MDDRRRKLLVNIGEFESDAVLRDVAHKHGARVFAKPRVADVVAIDSSGLPDDLYRYALRAHFDFVVARMSDAQALFAVEFDEAYHATDAQGRRRDPNKDVICEALGLPLIRVDADFLQTVKGFRLLAWLVELWFVQEAWDEAFGDAPEPFDPFSFFEPNGRGGVSFTYDLSDDAIASLRTAYGERRCLAPFPNVWFRTSDAGGEAHAFLPIHNARWLKAYVRVRPTQFPVGVSPGELAEPLAIIETASKFDEYERGVAVTVTEQEVDAIVAQLGNGWSSGIFRPGG